MKGPGLCSEVSGSSVGRDRPGGEGVAGGLVRFYKSQCKSRDKYYLLFEERHSRYLLYRGKGPVCLGHMFGLFLSETCRVKRLDNYSALSRSERRLT